jgi:GH24 family phage-related lysozyme (muramidase)
MESDIQLTDAALHTKGMGHQMDAWRWLQSVLSKEQLNTFGLKFRNKERSERIENQFVAPDAAFDIIRKYEGFRSHPYLCPAGVWTIGYGTIKYPNGMRVNPDDNPVTQKQAEEYLKYEANKDILPRLQRTVPHWFALNQNQQSALISFSYNLGAGFMEAESGFETIQKRLRNKEWNLMRDALMLYVKGGGKVLQGLVNRRKEEADLWETPVKA